MTFPWEVDHVYKSANDSRCNKQACSFYCVRIYFPLLNSPVISLVSVSFCSLRTPRPPPPPPHHSPLSLLSLISLSADIKDDCGNSCEEKPAVRLSSRLASDLLAPEETRRGCCCYSDRRQRRGWGLRVFHVRTSKTGKMELWKSGTFLTGAGCAGAALLVSPLQMMSLVCFPQRNKIKFVFLQQNNLQLRNCCTNTSTFTIGR